MEPIRSSRRVIVTLVESLFSTILSQQPSGAHPLWHARTARGSLQPEVESEPFGVGPGSKASEGVAGREMTRHIISCGSRGM
ncbi:BZ3500_MvSof-1268-A1-R1_Chr7-1g09396 [Microbotryum saponariae]|uniref:BZ3500_MvSof-1268-A1-R1_Chr7-1g09396 protein n=1 Tax=Microbotryum saponariae TaxID=289078 RepID=A0A2X0L950_9BASI|nr:BZ3501_MvSof-1269-A2-R1_Chr7-1g09101 [Microbotryum saponariae]SDA03361.1 BZ3500_MvSof-1268-A1-R1_Chr7-1g09396 [Microbotryum saponariae]